MDCDELTDNQLDGTDKNENTVRESIDANRNGCQPILARPAKRRGPERVAAREKRTAIGGSPPGRVPTLGERDSRLKYCASLRRDTAETQDNAESPAR